MLQTLYPLQKVEGRDLVPQSTVDLADEIAKAARSDNTRRMYTTHWRRYVDWCIRHGFRPLPVDATILKLYLTSCVDSHKVGTIECYLSVIVEACKLHGDPSPREHPVIKEFMKGLRNKYGAPQREADPILLETLKAMLSALPDNVIGIRDHALLVVGFASACRRSEIVGFRIEDLALVNEGYIVRIPRSKTDQEGQGRMIALPYGTDELTCPVGRLKAWFEASGISDGNVFRSVDRHGKIGAGLTDKAVALVVKRAAVRAGLDSTKLSGHSLRCGFVTEAKLRGHDDYSIMLQTGHKSARMVHKYTRRVDIFKQGAKVGL